MRHILIVSLLLLALAGIGIPASAAEPDANLFPFVLPADDVTEGITDLSFLNDKPADEWVSVRDGHFYAGGKRIRFWGVCVIGVAAFPSHEQAPIFAHRLASRGINQVRIHLIDGNYAPIGLFDPDAKGQLKILPSQLDKLDFFIAELKKRGIYVELPIHGYHWRNILGESDYPGADIKSFPAFGSGIPLWNPRFIETEKRFAREFFGHVNPYTGKAYTEEPCVSTLEVLNENGLICAWRGGHMRKVWPEAMVSDLRTHWNAFLKTRYGTSDRLRTAWAVGAVRADRKALLKNGDFADGMNGWAVQCVKPSTNATRIVPAAAPGGKPAAVLTGDRAPEPMAFVNLYQPGLTVEENARYVLSFYARSDAAAKLSVNVSMNHAPWNVLGISALVDIGPEWREVNLPFIGALNDTNAKLMISPPVGTSTVSVAGVSLRKADIDGLPDGESLAAGNVSMPLTPQDCALRTKRVAADFVDFLYELDGRYFDTMRDFVRNELHSRHPIKGTQVDQYSSYFSQARFDYLDSHGYWQHPVFPRKPWDPQDWYVGNSPMVNQGGDVAVSLAGKRVRGKPYNISEYSHPAPSTYSAEQVPTIAALGALQDWDGIVFHSMQELAYDWNRRAVTTVPADRFDNWFNMTRHPVKLVTLPFGALAFRRGDVSAAREETAIGVTLAEEKQWLAEKTGSTWRPFDVAAGKGATWRDAFTHRLSLALGSEKVSPVQSAKATRAVSDTGELDYDLGDPAAGVLTVNAPRAKAVIGYGVGKTFALGDVTLKPGPTMQKGFAVITASAVRGDSFRAPGARLLVTATGYIENKGMVWNAEKTSVGKQWGEGPTLCEGIPFTFALKAPRAAAWALDSRGRRVTPVPGVAGESGTTFAFGPQYKTLWYEIVVE